MDRVEVMEAAFSWCNRCDQPSHGCHHFPPLEVWSNGTKITGTTPWLVLRAGDTITLTTTATWVE